MIPRYSSYRDPRSSISFDGARVIRRFDEVGAKAFQAAEQAGVLGELVADGIVPRFEVIGDSPLLIAVDPISFVSYPEEWTPGMLRDAGLLTLEISRRLWSHGFHLRDASAYNVVFDGDRPVFVDLGSVGTGHTPLWTAYGQFCDHFLNPLLIESRLGIPFSDVWSLEGVSVEITHKMLHGSHRRGKGVLTNVTMRARLETKHSEDSAAERSSARKELSLSPQRVDALMEGMEATIRGLRFPEVSTWSHYEKDNSYDEERAASRDAAIRRFAQTASCQERALDIGANAGRHTAILAEEYQEVIAVDADRVALEALRTRFQDRPATGLVFPVVADIADPTSPKGFLNGERSGLIERLSDVDSAIWMAVIHHLAIGRGIPLRHIATLAATLAPRHLIEFVEPEDPMVQLLSASKSGEHHEYSVAEFESAFGEVFEVKPLGKTIPTRSLYEVTSNRRG